MGFTYHFLRNVIGQTVSCYPLYTTREVVVKVVKWVVSHKPGFQLTSGHIGFGLDSIWIQIWIEKSTSQ